MQSLVDGSSSNDEAKCNEVLSYFHTSCDPNEESCSKANQQAFQVTIDQVCEAVDTPIKLKFKVIGESTFCGFLEFIYWCFKSVPATI